MATPVAAFRLKGTMPTWCPGCGDYAVLAGVQKGLAEAGKTPSECAIVSGIGCSSNLPHFLKAYGMHTLHGRSLPVATGLKLANPDLTVVVTGGDGDGYGIGQGHFIHSMRRNLDLTYIVMNNEIYGLTTGQTSPTSMIGMETKSTPYGNIEHPVNPLGLALMSGATFVARGFSGDAKNLAEIIRQGVQHKGFSLIDVFSPCVTYNKLNTYDWFRERLYSLEAEGHDTSDFDAAILKSVEAGRMGDRIGYGVYYQTSRPTYEEGDIALRDHGAPVKQTLGMTESQQNKVKQIFL